MPRQHTAYLLRWQEDESGQDWRSYVENAYTGEKLYFNDRTELIRFLWQTIFPERRSLSDGREAKNSDVMDTNDL